MDNAERNQDEGLNVDRIFWSEKKDPKTMLDDTKDPLNDIPC